MATEEGIVTRIHPHQPTIAWVETVRSSACKACSARESCNAEPGGGKKMTVAVTNRIGARVGDHIVLHMATMPLLKASFLLYIFPVTCMVAGAGIGQYIAGGHGNLSTWLPVATAAAAFIAAFAVVKYRGSRLAARPEYQPDIIRITGHGPLLNTDTDARSPRHPSIATDTCSRGGP